ncbi:response regulator [Paenibacillus sp. H1-7]|uniref:response regulator n=1 Tax=Paenibacillus sp. H1-7 TaxID=2282849 RepID=UPI001EF97831|nr:response regulator [Paenibacillus sp. H1-7]
MIKAVIIDDDMTTIQGLTRSVKWDGYGIQVAATARNGKEGLEQIRVHRPDIILTDIFMPVMDGISMLQAVREDGNMAEVIILSGYEDFKCAQSAVKLNVNDYLSKPASLDDIERVLQETVSKIRKREAAEKEDKELRELLETNLQITKKQIVKGLLEPEFYHTPVFRKVSDYLKIDLSGNYFTVLLIEFFIKRERSFKPSDLSLFAYAVNNIVNELTQDKQGVYVADIQRNVITVIIATPSRVKKERVMVLVKQMAEEMLAHIDQYLKLQVGAAIGPVTDHIADIPKSYSAAFDLLAERNNMPGRQLISAEDLMGLPKPAARRPMINYQALADAVMAGQSELAEEKIIELGESLHGGTAPSVSVLREFAIDIVGILALALHDHGLQFEDIHAGSNMYKELEQLYSVSDFTGWLRDLLLPICETMNRRGSQKHRKTIDFIMRYVQQHYADDITLDVLAEKVYLTRNYLSQIFKQETGENYNSYLTRIRMEKAKELMLGGNYKIFEISGMVGYKNHAYFSQLFKKYSGLNPSEFNQ